MNNNRYVIEVNMKKTSLKTGDKNLKTCNYVSLGQNPITYNSQLSLNLPPKTTGNIKLTQKAVIILFLSMISMIMMSFHLMAFGIEPGKITNIKQIDDSTIPAVKESKSRPYDIEGLQKYLQNKQTANNNGYINLKQDLKIFPEGLKVNLTLNNIDVPSVLRVIAKEGQRNIIIDESVQGTINAQLKNVSLNDAFKIILISEELEARVEGDTIFVASRPVMSKKGLNRKYVKAFKLDNSNAVDVAQILEASVFNKGYKVNENAAGESGFPAMQAVQTDASQNQTPVASSTGQSTLADTKVMKGRVEEIEPGTGFGDAKLLASEIKIQSTKATTKDIKISNNDGGAIVIPDTRSNSVLVSGLKEDIELAEAAIAYLDKPLKQVAIEVSLIEINKDDTKNLGLSIEDVAGGGSIGFNSTAINTLHGLTSAANQTVIGWNKNQNIADNFYVKLNSLFQNQKAKLLANPTIIALDNSESLIKITDQVVSKMEVVVTQTTTTYDVTLADVGIVLNILPKIGDNGFVTMRIRPSITTPLAEKSVGTFGAFVTPISTREVIIQDVRVKSGETLAIAGLLKESEVETLGRVPLVSNMPVFGKLFQNKNYNHTKSELVILITPKIIQDEERV